MCFTSIEWKIIKEENFQHYQPVRYFYSNGLFFPENFLLYTDIEKMKKFRSLLNCKYFPPIHFPPLHFVVLTNVYCKLPFQIFKFSIDDFFRVRVEERKTGRAACFFTLLLSFPPSHTQKLLLPPFIPYFRFSINLIAYLQRRCEIVSMYSNFALSSPPS